MVSATMTPAGVSRLKRTKGCATYVVAASDAPDDVKRIADYICDGAADNVQIQAAVDALLAAGGKVLLAAGTFNVIDGIELPNRSTLSGVGYATIIDGAGLAVDEPIVTNDDYVGGNSHIAVENLSLNNCAATSTQKGALFFDKVEYCRASNLWIENSGCNGILCHQTNYSIIDNIQIKNVALHAIYVGAALNTQTGSSHNTISNIVSEVPGLEHVCIETPPGAQATEENWNEYNTVTNCTGSGANNSGYYIGHAKHTAMSNCVSNGSYHNGVYLQDTKMTAISNFICREVNDGGAHAEAAGIKIEGNTYCTSITGGVVEDCPLEFGISIQGVQVSVTGLITKNCYRGFDIFNLAFYDDARDNIAIRGCIFHDNHKFMRIRGTNIILNDNIFSESSPQGLQFGVYLYDDCDKVQIIGNQLNMSVPGPLCLIENYRTGTATNIIVSNNLGYRTENHGSSVGTGAQQTIAHGLADRPTIIIITGDTTDVNGLQSAAPTNVNMYITADNGEAYHWQALARY